MIDPACTEEAPQASESEPQIEIDIQRVMQMIPHRQPFLMIDRVIDVVANARATGIKNITINEPYFQGHFPTRPVMPGVLIIEAMAQTAAVLVVHTLGPEAEGKLVYFMSVDNARFRRPVFPGDVLHVRVTKQRHRGNVWRFEGRAEVAGRLMAEAVFAALILDD
jgi:3-hydroxyacyl-[acyl-carrier-protein] dehydratase